MFRLAHISDPHLGPLPEATAWQLANKRIFGYVNWRRNRKGVLTTDILDNLISDMQAHAPDHLAVTGDLVNLALPAEIANARRWLTSLGTPEDVSVIPGNHDAYVPNARMKAEEAWRPFMSGDIVHSGSLNFPYLRIRGKVAIIGVNSARATLPLMATGYFRKAQARALSKLLDGCKEKGLFRVVLIHHPPLKHSTHWHKRLIGASRFRKTLRKHGAELVLHGHTHLLTKAATEGPHGPIPVICVPSASQGPGSRSKPPARYNLFEIGGKDGDWQCRLIERGYSSEDKIISELGNQLLTIPNA